MRRERFLLGAAASIGASLAWPRLAAATGGLDPELGTPPPMAGTVPGGNPAVRVLLASNVDPARIPPAGAAATFSFGGRIYRGGPSVIDGPDQRPALISTVPIDAYLYGVVPLEIGRGVPDGALQAQAIVARTYAFTHRVKGREYDLVANAGDQMWGGIQAESPQTNAAVDATEGQVVTFMGGLASVFYSACCGGHTADASRMWGGSTLPYLRGVPDPYCLRSPYANWSANLTVGMLLNALGSRATALMPLESITLGDATADGRTGLRITGKSGSVLFTSSEVRRAVGPGILRSGLLRSLMVQGDPAQYATAIKVTGSGSGHGVGLCQWGAKMMAKQGRSAREIIAYYFPETLVATA